MFKKMPFKCFESFSLGWKIVLAAVTIAGLFQIVQTTSWIYVYTDTLKNKFDTEILNAVRIVRPPLALSIEKGDAEIAERAAEELTKFPDFLFIRVSNSGFRLMDHARDGTWQFEWENRLTREGVFFGRDTEIFHFDDMVIATVQLIGSRGTSVGEIAIGFSLDGLHREVRTASRRAFFLIASCTVFAAVIFILLARNITEPLRRISRSVQAFSTGDPEVYFPRFSRSDEIGRLSAALREMHRGYLEARTDRLTDLPTRRVLEDIIEGRHKTFPLTGDSAFWIVDIDDFKPVNDGFGHNAGDHVLVTVAERIRNLVGDAGCVLRFGGDEFGVFWANAADREDMLRTARAVHQAVCEPVFFDGSDLFVGASIGIACASDLENPGANILSAADTAMYVAKGSNSDKISVFSGSRQERRHRKRQSREIEASISNGLFFPHFQPIVNLDNGSMAGFEALARTHGADGSIRSAFEFIRRIEEYQLQGQFDLSIIRQVLEQARNWKENGLDVPNISVNASEQSLANPRFRSQLLFQLDAFRDIVPHLTIEITENALIDRSAAAIRQGLTELSEIGVRLSMDDFGTGYGSFRHLKEYSFDELKIDREFVNSMLDDDTSLVIISGFLSIAEGLGACVVAEGIETAAQVRRLRKLGCKYGQGFLFSRPVDAASATQMLETGQTFRFVMGSAA